VKLTWLILPTLAVLALAGYFAERRTSGQLRREIDAYGSENRVLAILRSEYALLNRMQPVVSAPERTFPAKINSAKVAPSETMFASAPPLTWVPASAWRNAGRLTPKAAFETILWASANGDVDAVADAISLGATARANAEKILSGLPEADRQAMGGPEQVMALLIARDMPTQAVEFYDVQPNDSNGAIVCALGVDAEGTPHFLQYYFQRGDDGWLLQTAGPTVNEAHYVQELTGRAPSAAPLSSNNVPEPQVAE
jgi:hypothetical protein